MPGASRSTRRLPRWARCGPPARPWPRRGPGREILRAGPAQLLQGPLAGGLPAAVRPGPTPRRGLQPALGRAHGGQGRRVGLGAAPRQRLQAPQAGLHPQAGRGAEGVAGRPWLLANVRTIQDMLGHGSLATTMRYLGVNEADIEVAILAAWPTAGERASSGTTPRRPTSTSGARCSPRTCPSSATAEGRKQVGGPRAALSVVWARLSAACRGLAPLPRRPQSRASASCGSLLLLVSFLAPMAAEQQPRPKSGSNQPYERRAASEKLGGDCAENDGQCHERQGHQCAHASPFPVLVLASLRSLAGDGAAYGAPFLSPEAD
jgi:hypothetical protein